MDIPTGKLDQLLKAMLYPAAFLDALEDRAAKTQVYPYDLWRLVALLACAGALVYGFTIGLVIKPWSAPITALVVLASVASGWLAFLPLYLRGPQEPRRWLRIHIAMVAMMYGEMIFEFGMVLNTLFWIFDWLSNGQAQLFNLLWLALADVTMIIMIVTAWRTRNTTVAWPIALWLGAFHVAAITVAILLGRVFGLIT